jgi:hypothetical protein
MRIINVHLWDGPNNFARGTCVRSIYCVCRSYCTVAANKAVDWFLLSDWWPAVLLVVVDELVISRCQHLAVHVQLGR